MKLSGRAILTALAVSVVAAAVIAGLVLIGSPAEERMRRIDAKRVSDLRMIVSSIDAYWRRHQLLPSTLEDFANEPNLSPPPRDPETDQAYEYRALDSTAYEICSVFHLPAAGNRADPDFWFHAAGRQCFFREVTRAAD